MNFKEKTLFGITWSFFDNSISQILQFVIGIILARLLSPAVFGLIGMVMIFLGVSQVFTEGGLRQALIRKQNCTEDDYNTVFFTSLLISLILYSLIFLLAPNIAVFYEEPKLTNILRVLSIYIIIDAFGNVHGAILSKEINYKLRTKITLFATFIAGITGISLAIFGFGVWSLVIKQLLQALIFILLLWHWSNWRPKLKYNLTHLKEHLKFSLPLLASNLLETIYNYTYYMIIGKFYSAKDLGFYTRAITFSNLPSSNIIGVTDRVTYPLLSTLQNDNKILKEKLSIFIKYISLLTFFISVLIAASAKSIVLVLIGEKWYQSIIYVQLLCFAFFFFPIISLFMNIIKVKGQTKLFFKVELIRKLLAIPLVFIIIHYGIITLIFGMIFHSIISLSFYGYYNYKLIQYSFLEQLHDILPAFIISMFIFITIFTFNLLDLNSLYLLLLQTTTGIIIFYILNKLINSKEFDEIKEIIRLSIKNK